MSILHNPLKYIFLFLVVGCTLKTHAQEASLVITKDVEEARQVASSTGKLILIDFYTDWCGPCKKFDKGLSLDTAMQRTIGKNYVMLKHNPEKDLVPLGFKYHIYSFPTMVVVSNDFQYVGKLYGGKIKIDQPSDLISFLEKSVERASTSKFRRGYSTDFDTTSALYRSYRRIKRADTTLVIEGLKTESRFTEYYLGLLTHGAVLGTLKPNNIDFFTSNRNTYSDLFGEEHVDYVLRLVQYDLYVAAIKKGSSELWKKANAFGKTYLSDSYDRIREAYKLDYLIAKKDWKSVKDHLTKTVDKSDPDEVNNCAWTLYMKCDDRELLELAVSWMNDVLKGNENYARVDTYGRLLYKLGHYQEAKTVIEKSIEYAKREKMDHASNDKLLEEIRNKLN
ncbi:MAG: thioredoxin family protein [Bacteroidia bacterium]|nr:thioredoxin family protein [Bacteroidia bacterium]